jgi:hypothetical protein
VSLVAAGESAPHPPVHSRWAAARRKFGREVNVRATIDEGHEVARAALLFAIRWIGMLALALGAAALIVEVS